MSVSRTEIKLGFQFPYTISREHLHPLLLSFTWCVEKMWQLSAKIETLVHNNFEDGTIIM